MPILIALLMLALAACDDVSLPLMPAFNDAATNLQPGTYSVSMTIEVLATADEVRTRCNFGVPVGESRLGCVFPNANPPLMVVPLVRSANDWHSQCVWGHETMHVVHGDWHAVP